MLTGIFPGLSPIPPLGKNPWNPLDKILGGPQRRHGAVQKREVSATTMNRTPNSLSHTSFLVQITSESPKDRFRIYPPFIHRPQERHRVPEPFIRVCRYPDQARCDIDPSYSCNVRGVGGGSGLSLQEGSASNPQPKILAHTYQIVSYFSIPSSSTLCKALFRACLKSHYRKYFKKNVPLCNWIRGGWVPAGHCGEEKNLLPLTGMNTDSSRFPIRRLGHFTE
jgi:hypothetical protein